MNKLYLVLAFLFCTIQVRSEIEADINFSLFNASPEPFIELNYYFIASSLKYNQIDSLQQQASLEIIIIFKKGEEIFKFDKYVLNSPLAHKASNFFDTKRYALPNGTYEMEISISNIADPLGVLTKKETITVDFDSSTLSMSTVQLLSKIEASDVPSPMVKNGYFMELLPFSYYNMAFNQLTFYFEIYNSDASFPGDYVISYKIFKKENNERLLIKKKFKRRSPAEKDALVLNLDLEDIKSGNYDLELAIQDKSKEVKLKEVIPFRRSNPVLDTKVKMQETNFDINKTFVAKMTKEELRYNLRAIAPRVHSEDIEALNLLIRNKDEQYQKIFLHNFWFVQDSKNTEKTFLEYMEVAKAVDQMFQNGFGPGFESDRGYLFLKYGRPDDKVESLSEVATFPFEIWIYNKLDYLNQTNVRFLFYNTSLVPNGHRLLHSTAIGEISNTQFRSQLFRSSSNQDLEALNMIQQFFPEL